MLLVESSSLGLRRWRVERRKLPRRLVRVQTEYGPIRLKLGGPEGPGQILSPEFEDCRRLALEQALPLKVLYEAARSAWRDGKVLPIDGANEGT